MKDREGAHHHTPQPELAQPQEQHRYRVDHYGKSRNFAAYEGHTIIAVTLYRKGAAEIIARLAEKDGRIAALESQLATMSESQVFPGPSSPEPVPAPPWTPPRQLALIAAEDMPAYRITPPHRRPAPTSADLEPLHSLLGQHEANIPFPLVKAFPASIGARASGW